jgi:FkbM family methyltransferase
VRTPVIEEEIRHDRTNLFLPFEPADDGWVGPRLVEMPLRIVQSFMGTRENQSDRTLERHTPRTLANIGLRLMGSEGKVGRLRSKYLEAAALRTDIVILQIGANDGIFDDPLYPFFHKNPHVRGILIEPQKGPYEKLLTLYRDNQNVTCVRTAISATTDYLSLWSVNLGEDPFGKAIARTNPEKLDYVMWRRPGKRLKGYEVESEDVPAAPLSDVLEELSVSPEQISAVFTDTEGSDIEVVNQLLNTGARPEVLQYEHVIAGDEVVFETNRRLAGMGYELSWSFRDIFAALRAGVPAARPAAP